MRRVHVFRWLADGTVKRRYACSGLPGRYVVLSTPRRWQFESDQPANSLFYSPAVCEIEVYARVASGSECVCVCMCMLARIGWFCAWGVAALWILDRQLTTLCACRVHYVPSIHVPPHRGMFVGPWYVTHPAHWPIDLIGTLQ